MLLFTEFVALFVYVLGALALVLPIAFGLHQLVNLIAVVFNAGFVDRFADMERVAINSALCTPLRRAVSKGTLGWQIYMHRMVCQRGVISSTIGALYLTLTGPSYDGFTEP